MSVCKFHCIRICTLCPLVTDQGLPSVLSLARSPSYCLSCYRHRRLQNTTPAQSVTIVTAGWTVGKPYMPAAKHSQLAAHGNTPRQPCSRTNLPISTFCSFPMNATCSHASSTCATLFFPRAVPSCAKSTIYILLVYAAAGIGYSCHSILS